MTLTDMTEYHQAEQDRNATIAVLGLLNSGKAAHELMRDIVAFLQGASGCEAVGIRLRDGDDFPYFETRGFSEDFLQAENHLCEVDEAGDLVRDSQGNPTLACMCGNIVLGRFDSSKPFFTKYGSFWTNSTTRLLATTTEADRLARTRNRCNHDGYESVALIPLCFEGGWLGLLQFNDKRQGRFTPALIAFLEKAAGSLAIGLAQRKAAEALQEGATRHRCLHESMMDAFVSTDMSGRIRDSNKAYRDMLGYSEQELAGLTYIDVTPEKWHALEARIVDEQVVRQGYSEVYEKEYQKKDGTVFPAELRKILLRDATGRPTGMWSIVRDITERRQTETALQRSEERYRRITQALTDYIVTVRVESGQAMETIHGLACEAVTGYSIEDIRSDPSLWIRMVHVDDQTAVRRQAARVLTGESPEPLEHRIRRKDGALRWVRNTTVPHYDAQGRMLSYDCLIQDITERKQAEVETQQVRSLLRNIIDSMPSILIGVDCEGRVTTWNREAQQATGLSDREAVGQTFEAVFPLPEAAGEMEKVRAGIRDRAVQKSETIQCTRHGEARYVNVITYPLITDGVQGAVIQIDDVTRQVHLEEMMVQAEKMRAVGGLAAGMAHEINNPLGAILQAAQNIQRRTSVGISKNGEVARQCNTTVDAVHDYLEKRGVTSMLEDIRQAGGRAARIVTSMLHFSRHDGADFAPACLATLIDRAVELAVNDYDLRRHYDFRHIQIVRDFDPGLPAIPCRGTEIQQVLLNMLKNAAQAMTEMKGLSTPWISVRTRREADMARIEIEDNGPGMTEEVRTRIFEPLFTTKKAGIGTGLGLSIAYTIIANTHKGTITVKSTPGRGTMFTIGLPLSRSGI